MLSIVQSWVSQVEAYWARLLVAKFGPALASPSAYCTKISWFLFNLWPILIQTPGVGSFFPLNLTLPNRLFLHILEALLWLLTFFIFMAIQLPVFIRIIALWSKLSDRTKISKVLWLNRNLTQMSRPAWLSCDRIADIRDWGEEKMTVWDYNGPSFGSHLTLFATVYTLRLFSHIVHFHACSWNCLWVCLMLFILSSKIESQCGAVV